MSYFRREYNRGKLLDSNPGRKGPISFKYNENGERITNYYSHGKPAKLLPQKEYDRILTTYGPDIRTQPDFDFTVREKKPDIVRKPMGKLTYDRFDWCI